MTRRVLSTLICTALAACGGGGGGDTSTTSSSTTSALAVATTPAATTSTTTTPAVTTSTTTTADATSTTTASDVTSVATTDTSTASTTAAAATSATATTPVATVTTVAAQTDTATTSTSAFGTYLRPYAVNSLWNSRPLNPVFGTFVIPTSIYFPTVASGAYSTGMFLAAATDQPMTVVGTASTGTTTVGVADPDSGGSHVVTIPRWPAGVIPATGSDGHADIVDPITDTIHSFWQLKQVNGQWRAALYSWSKLSGTGWGDPAHYYQGARAVGIPASAGLIRKQEMTDGQATYPHALAMSLTSNALSNGVSSPAYVFPATSADNTASSNTGSIPEGALLMLPPSFDSSAIVNPDLKKIVETLKLYGAYVVDRNTGTPFVIYVENDGGYNLMPAGWDNTVAGQLDAIRASLRQVVSAPAWVDGNGNPATDAIAALKTMNILSVRGPWYRQSGTTTATFDTASQSLLFAATTTKAVFSNANNTGLTPVKWATPVAGTYVKFTVTATGGAKLCLHVWSDTAATFNTTDLGDGESVRILWPANGKITLIATSGNNGVSSVKANLVPSP